jgi:hypothetical protein
MILGVLRQIVSRNKTLVKVRDQFVPDTFPKGTCVGEFTYGLSPSERFLRDEEQANFSIGKFCSITDSLSIFLGGGTDSIYFQLFPSGMFRHSKATSSFQIIRPQMEMSRLAMMFTLEAT